MDTLFTSIKSEIDKTQNYAFALRKKGIEQKDVRFAFFELFQNYYSIIFRVHSYMGTDQFKKDSVQIYFNIKGLNDENDMINVSAQSNYTLIIESWSTFELCISQICKKVLTQEVIEKLLEYNFRRIDKILKHSLPETTSKELLVSLKLKHIELVSINLKTDQIYNIVKYEDYKKDKEFLLFYGKLRNSIHSNFVYFGNPYEYKFKDTVYTFENGKPIKQEPLNFDQNLTIFDLSVELRDIFYRIISNLKYEGLIFDPSFADTK